ncbi:MAG: hypothetical protein KBT34_10580 [Prevotella sp.]|nr:hypothetical protein [Candidatus Prevotella equi]
MNELTEIEKILRATRGLKEGSLVADKAGQPFRVSHIDKDKCVIVSCDGRELKHNEIYSLEFTEKNLVKIGFKKIRGQYQYEWNDLSGRSYKMVISRTKPKDLGDIEKDWRVRLYNFKGIRCDLRIGGLGTLMDSVQEGWRHLFYGTPLGLPGIWR